LNAFSDGLTLFKAIEEYMEFYNHDRLHQSLGYMAPAQLYQQAA